MHVISRYTQGMLADTTPQGCWLFGAHFTFQVMLSDENARIHVWHGFAFYRCCSSKVQLVQEVRASMGRRFLGLTKMKSCYVCSSTTPAELPAGDRCCFTQCWGPELYRAVHQAAQTPETDQTEEQHKILVDSAEGTHVREQRRFCPHGHEGKRFFHQTCLQTSFGQRHHALSHDNKLFAAPGRKPAGVDDEVTAHKALRDLRHHLCHDCLMEVTGSFDVKSPPIRSLRGSLSFAGCSPSVA